MKKIQMTILKKVPESYLECQGLNCRCCAYEYTEKADTKCKHSMVLRQLEKGICFP
jgi:hypothetical protein